MISNAFWCKVKKVEPTPGVGIILVKFIADAGFISRKATRAVA
jgi:hypothetical protein